MIDKLKTLETKRARRAKHYAPKFDIRALEMELRKENQHGSSNDPYSRMDYSHVDDMERGTKQ